MIPTLGLIVVTYAVARLIQAPIECFRPGSARWIVVAIVSVLAIVALGILTVNLILTGTKIDLPVPR
jgi:hypothetical protein